MSEAMSEVSCAGDPYDSRVASDAITLRLVKVHHEAVDGGTKITDTFVNRLFAHFSIHISLNFQRFLRF